MIQKIQQRLSRQTKAEILTLSFSMTVVLFLVDLFGPPIGLSVFYLCPPCLTAWYAGRRAGLLMVIACVIARSAARELEGPPHAYPWIPYWNAAIRLVSNSIFVWLVSAIRKSQTRLQSHVEQRTAELQEEIVGHKRSEEELRTIGRRFQQVTDNIREVFWITDCAKNQMIYVSPGYETIWGRTCASLYESPRDWLEAIHTEDRPRVQQAMIEKQVRGDYDEEYRILRPDGKVRWIRDRAFPVRSERGEVFRIVGIADDITDRKAAEAAIREKDRRLQVVLDRAPIVMFAIAKDGRFTMSEGHALYDVNLSPGALAGRPYQEVLVGYPSLLERVERALRGEEFVSTDEFRGQMFTTWHAPERNERGEITGMVGVATNVTERFHLQRQIMEISDREQSRIGHDLHDGLCQYLVGIAFAATTLEKQLASRGTVDLSEVRQIGVMLDEAITQARKTVRGLYPVKLEAEGLAAALSELAASTRERHGLDCRFDYAEPVLLFSDLLAMQLYRIAQEAVLNAVKHAKCSRINIQLTRSADRVDLCVQDDGVGISDPPSGTGMGLHIMEYRAHTIGGTFRFCQRREGGTEVFCSVVEKPGNREIETETAVP